MIQEPSTHWLVDALIVGAAWIGMSMLTFIGFLLYIGLVR